MRLDIYSYRYLTVYHFAVLSVNCYNRVNSHSHVVDSADGVVLIMDVVCFVTIPARSSVTGVTLALHLAAIKCVVLQELASPWDSGAIATQYLISWTQSILERSIIIAAHEEDPTIVRCLIQSLPTYESDSDRMYEG